MGAASETADGVANHVTAKHVASDVTAKDVENNMTANNVMTKNMALSLPATEDDLPATQIKAKFGLGKK